MIVIELLVLALLLAILSPVLAALTVLAVLGAASLMGCRR